MDPVAAFVKAASVDPDRSHREGTLDEARAILAGRPDLAGGNIYAAAVLADEASVRRLLESEPARATAKGGPHGWDALTYLCFSKYVRLDRDRSPRFVDTARALLDAGADPHTGFHRGDVFESVVYGAAGVAPGCCRRPRPYAPHDRDQGVRRFLLDRLAVD